MKRYALYPGVGKVTPDGKLQYVTGKQLAACYRVPYSDCLDTDIPAIKKVISLGVGKSAPVYLTHLIPSQTGHYRIPDKTQSGIILSTGMHEQVSKNG